MISYSNLSFISVQAVDHEKEVEELEVPLCPGLLTHEIAAQKVVSEEKPLKCIHEAISLNPYFHKARTYSRDLNINANAAVCLVLLKFNRITPVLCDLHWLQVPYRFSM